MASISKSYTFSAAHHLPQLPDGHPCKRVHGHNYEVVVTVRGTINKATGMILDYADLDKVVLPWVNALDHQDLNAIVIEGFRIVSFKGEPFVPTAETLAMVFHEHIRSALRKARHQVSITVKETPKTAAVYP